MSSKSLLAGGLVVWSRPAGFRPDRDACRTLSCKGALPFGRHIPDGDAEFNAWLDNFVTDADTKLANTGPVQGDIDSIVTAWSLWNATLTVTISA